MPTLESLNLDISRISTTGYRFYWFLASCVSYVYYVQFACPIRIRETHGSAPEKVVGPKSSAGGGVSR